VPNATTELHAKAEIQPALPKSVIRHWEGIFHNKHKTSPGYDKDVCFHIPDYSKPIKFQSARFLQDGSSSPTPHDGSPPAVLDFVPLP